MKEKIKFAIIGCGHIGKMHAKMIIDNPSCDLVALCDPIRESELDIQELPKTPLYTSLDSLINSGTEFDVACICTPNGLHAQQSLTLLKNGYHVVCEKPMGLNSMECRAVIEKSEEVKKKVFCVMQNRYSPPSKWLKNIISDNVLGDIFMVQVNCFWNRDHRYYSGSNWRGTSNLDGGTLFTQFSHFIDTLYWTLGELKILSADFRDFNHKKSTSFEDSGIVNFEKRISGVAVFTTILLSNNQYVTFFSQI